MHILHVETGRHVYGGAAQVLHLVAGLADRGVRGTLVCAEDGRVATAARERGIDALPVPMRGDLDAGFIPRLWRIIRLLEPAIVHIHSRRGADWFGGLAARLAGVPAVLSRRVDSEETIAGRTKYRLYRRVIAISGCIHAQLVAAGMPEDKVRLVRSGIPPAAGDPAWSRARFRREFGLDDDAFVIGVIAQLIPRKGHADLLDALPAVLAGHAGTRALLFGAGALEAQIEALAEQKQLGDVVGLAGFREDLPEFLGHLDVIVHPAAREGLGVSLLEAQAAGVPVVAFRAGGVPEAVNDGVTGTLLSSRDIAGLERAILHLARDPQARAKMGAAAREWVADQFGVDAMIDGNLAVYRELAGQT